MAFATDDDVATRLGRVLTSAEEAQATAVIATVTGLIADAAGRDGDWATALSPVPETLKALCVEKAVGAIVNPSNLAAQSETLGAASRSQTFPRSGDVGVFLTDAETRLVSWAVYGTNSGTASPESMVDRVIDLAEGREVDEDPPE